MMPVRELAEPAGGALVYLNDLSIESGQAQDGAGIGGTGSLTRGAVEAFIRRRYREEHGADIRAFMPVLYALSDGGGKFLAAAGCRFAAQAPLFLERYLDEPVECALSRAAAEPVCRGQVVEVGNLAGVLPGATRLLIRHMGRQLVARGARWGVATLLPAVANAFRRTGAELYPLARAEPARLGKDAAAWGRYYEQVPVVMGVRYPRGPLR